TSTSFGSGRSVTIEPMSAMRSTPGRFAADLTNLNTSSRNRSRPPAESREREECRFLVRHKSCDRLVAHLEEPDDVGRRAIPPPNPDHLRWRPEQDTQSVKVLVLGHDDQSVIASMGPRLHGPGRRPGRDVTQRADCHQASSPPTSGAPSRRRPGQSVLDAADRERIGLETAVDSSVLCETVYAKLFRTGRSSL